MWPCEGAAWCKGVVHTSWAREGEQCCSDLGPALAAARGLVSLPVMQEDGARCVESAWALPWHAGVYLFSTQVPRQCKTKEI